ncbi:MAG: hypothetical protein HYY16_11645 [Planctomycetes bacterium]|nr:hypothetical protein [Planctomycetota bacterium]
MDVSMPPDAVCVPCPCGKRAIVESRWFNKPQSCAACERQFMVLMIQEPAGWRPQVMFAGFTESKTSSGGPAPTQTTGPWFNVLCACGRKIGVDRRLAGRITRCSMCNQEILIALRPTPGGGDTTEIIRGASDKTSFAFPTPRDLPPPPTEMHLLCTCGEELLILREFYGSIIRCGTCGIRLQLRLHYDGERNRYELHVEVIT